MPKSILPRDYFSHVQVPDDWDSLESFMEWYLESKMPMMVPWNAGVVCSDDATAICLFRKGPYQVELYLVHPLQYVPKHEHPSMEVITLFLAGGETCPPSEGFPAVGRDWGLVAPKLLEGQSHGGVINTVDKSGYALLAFQRWPEGTTPLTAAVQWRGDTAGPKQERLIRKAYPQAYIEPGYADITGKPKEPQ